MINICPNCKQASYAPQSQREDMNIVLGRWEKETITRFSPETKAEYTTNNITTFYRCNNCTFGAFVPACAGTANFYNDITVEGDYYVHEKWEFTKTYRLIKNESPKSLLDYGCGGGAFLKKAAGTFPKTSFDGFDKNPQAKQTFEGTSIGFTHDLSAHNGKSYDMITAFQILEHLEDPFSALKDLHNCLNNNGILVISVPNIDGPIRHFPNSLTEIPPHHVNRFGRTSLQTYLHNEGFKIQEVAYEPLSKTLWPFYLPVMIRKALPDSLQKIFVKLKGPGFVQLFVSILNKTGLKSLPVKGHSIYVVARKCAE